MVKFIKANGIVIESIIRALNSIKMVTVIQVNGIMVKDKAKVN